jgi:hypothetical protein
MVLLTFTHFEDGAVTWESDFNILELLGVSGLEAHDKLLIGDIVSLHDHGSSAHLERTLHVFDRHLL